MKRRIYLLVSMCWFVAFFFFTGFSSCSQPLRVSKQNPHYVEFGGTPRLLITSGEHYGAVVNLDFDYTVYLDALHAQGMNNARIFSGTFAERKEDVNWVKPYSSPLAPRPGRLIAPWARSSQPGYFGGGNKFDLDKWDELYFARLKNFIQQAGARGIFVELTLFCNYYMDALWKNSPLYPGNNIQGEGPAGEGSFQDCLTMKNKALLARGEALVKKMTSELNGFDNLYYEVCNEPYWHAKDTAAVTAWCKHMTHFLAEQEAALPNRHLIASNDAIPDFQDVDIANVHYIHVGNFPSFDWLYRLNKPVSMDETNGTLVHSTLNDMRVEAWDLFFKGGGAYNNLNWLYTPSNPSGGDSARLVRSQLQVLRKFLIRQDFIRLYRDTAVVLSRPAGSHAPCLSEKGKRYLIYLHHSKEKGAETLSGYEAMVETFHDTVLLNLPAGQYKLRYVKPETGVMLPVKSIAAAQQGKPVRLTPPAYLTDIAILVTKTE